MSIDEEHLAVFAYAAYVSEWIAYQGDDPMVYDLVGYYDSTLTVDENIRILCGAYPTLRQYFVTRPNFLEWFRGYERAQRADGAVQSLTWRFDCHPRSLLS